MFKEYRDQFKDLKEDAEQVLENGRSRLRIPSADLPDVLNMHSEYFHSVSSMWAKVNFFVKRVRQFFDEREANISLDVRESPEKYDIDKVTENAITAYLKTDEELLNLKNLRIQAEYQLEELQALMNAFEHRRSMINNAMDLFKSGIYDTSEARVADYKENVRRAKKRGSSEE